MVNDNQLNYGVDCRAQHEVASFPKKNPKSQLSRMPIINQLTKMSGQLVGAEIIIFRIRARPLSTLDHNL